MGQTLLSSNNNWLAVEQNLQRARGKWGQLTNILGRERADKRMAGKFYVAVAQAVILFRSETWVIPRLDSIKGVHHQEVQRMAGMIPKR